MDIYLSINNREQVIQLPILPSEFEITSPQKHETFETINQGDLKLIGPDGLKSITIDTFFPKKPYAFSRVKNKKGWEYVKTIEAWRKREIPMRLTITGTPINMAVVIDNFDYGVRDGSGDIYYTLSLSEYKLIYLKKVRR